MIEIEQVAKCFSDGLSLHYRDYCFETGKSYVLLGASGCGKSTLLNMISGVMTPDAGKILVDGVEISNLPQKQKDAFRIAKIGYVFQDFKLMEEMRVEDNIRLLRLEHVDVSDMDAILDRLGILRLKKHRVAQLSGGEKQRVVIARALVKKPDVILADEPTGNLNYEIGRTIMQELLQASEGKTLICVTHDDRLAKMFDVVLDMNSFVTSDLQEMKEGEGNV